MKTKTFFFTALLFAALGSFATSNNEAEAIRTVSVSGQVMDFSTGEALAGVKVMVEETAEFSYTDFDGNFTIEGLIPGCYNLSATFISYKDAEQPLSLDNTSKVELKLEQITK